MGRKEKSEISVESASAEKDVAKEKKPRKRLTAKDRVKAELADLMERNVKLGNLLGKIKSDNWESHQKLLNSLSGEQKKLLASQYILQNKLIHVLKKRLEIWTEEK